MKYNDHDYQNNWRIPKKDWFENEYPCLHPGHNPPNMLYIPPFSSYTHVCSACGYRVVLHGSRTFMCVNS